MAEKAEKTEKSEKSVSKPTLERLTVYLNYLKSLPDDSPSNISAASIATALGLNNVQVRKDLAEASDGGKPKIGYITEYLISDIEHFLGYDDTTYALIVGAGNLGRALISYEGFQNYGLKITAAFDRNPGKKGIMAGRLRVLPLSDMAGTVRERNIKIGIITVPAESAQNACDLIVSCGIKAVWNFAPVHLTVPSDVLVQNENMAISLAHLSKHLSERR